MAIISKDFSETSIPNTFIVNIKERWSMTFPEFRVPEFYRVIFSSIATVLKYNRTKSKPRIAFRLVNDAGEFRLGAILEYLSPDEAESEDTGNWALSFTFYEDDLKDIADCYDNMSETFIVIANGQLFDTIGGHFAQADAATHMFTAAIEVLKGQMANMADADEGSDVEVELPGVFKATVGFEDGQKVFAITPGYNIKQLIKEDKKVATK